MELIIWQNYLNLNCVHFYYWQVSFNKTEYYVSINIVLNLLFLNLKIEHLKFNTIIFFMAVF